MDKQKPIEHVPVRSSNIISVGYDKDSCILEVKFNGGGLYRYHEVPKNIYEGINAVDSVGRYFFQNVRDKFRTERIK